jgi:tetratricopeptide (TPR) repeat protein
VFLAIPWGVSEKLKKRWSYFIRKFTKQTRLFGSQAADGAGFQLFASRSKKQIPIIPLAENRSEVSYYNLEPNACRWRRHPGNVTRHELRHRQRVLQVIESHCNDRRISRRSSQIRRSGLTVSLGRAYLKLGRINEAKACFREAIALTPYRVRAWRSLLRAWLIERAGRS